jgi:hypothetical protein
MKKKELECIYRMVELDMYYELKEYLVENEFADEKDFVADPTVIGRSKVILSSLNKAVEDKKLQLLDFEWTYLPLEFIKLTCVSEEGKTEFIHG